MTDMPRIYDVNTDSLRDVTQEDIDRMQRFIQTYGMVSRTMVALLRLQILASNDLIDSKEAREACERLQAVALMPGTATSGKYRSIVFDEGEIDEIRKKKEEV